MTGPEEIGRLLKSQHTIKDYETSIVDKSGREIPILLSASEITADNGEVIGNVGFFDDQRQKRLARDVNEYLVRLQTQAQKLGQVLDALAEQIHSLVGADSVVIYPYNPLTPQSYDVENIGRFGLLNRVKNFSAKIRTEGSQTRRLFLQGPGSRLVVDDVSTGRDRDGAELVLAGENRFWKREQIGGFTALGRWLEDMRQVDLNSSVALTDLAGNRTTHGKFAARHSIRLAPTVKVFDPAGWEAAEPLVGLLTPELYGHYLERALEEGLARAQAVAGRRPH